MTKTSKHEAQSSPVIPFEFAANLKPRSDSQEVKPEMADGSSEVSRVAFEHAGWHAALFGMK